MIFLVLSIRPVFAGDLYLAKVLSVDDGVIVVEILGDSKELDQGVTVIQGDEVDILLKPGDFIRIWGTLNVNTRKLTVTKGMNRITASGARDRSGVRMRLLKSMKKNGPGKGRSHGKP